MLVSQRDPIDVIAIPGAPPVAELVYSSAADLLAKSQTSRPYAAAIVRGAVSLDEIDEMKAQDLRKDSPVRNPNFIEPINQAMSDYWQQQPLAAQIAVKGLAFERLIRGEGKPAHIDQKITPKDVIPQAGPLAALLVMEGRMDYGFKASGKNVFDRKDRSFFAETSKSQPQGMKYLHPPAEAGDVVILKTDTIHFGKAMTKKRLVAAYLSRFALLNPVE